MLFDIDGTILLTGGAGREALELAFAELAPEVPTERVVEAAARVEYGGRTDPLILGDIARNLGWDAPTFAPMAEELMRRYVHHLGRRLAHAESPARLMPGIRALLAVLAEDARASLGLITGNSEAGARTKLEPFDLNGYFPIGGYGSDHADRREVARVAHSRSEAWYERRFLPEQVVVIGDTAHDVDCAHANGFRVLGVGTGGRTAEVTAARPDHYLDDLSDTQAAAEAIFTLSAP